MILDLIWSCEIPQSVDEWCERSHWEAHNPVIISSTGSIIGKIVGLKDDARWNELDTDTDSMCSWFDLMVHDSTSDSFFIVFICSHQTNQSISGTTSKHQ